MLTLFHAPKSRSTRFIWLLEELDAPYTLKVVTIRRGDGSGALDSANPHPHGKVPVITDGDTIVFESPAIALYLTDSYPKSRIGPLAGEPTRGAYLSWLAYYGDVMEPAFMSKFMNTPVPRGTAGWVVMDEAMEFVIRDLVRSSLPSGRGVLGGRCAVRQYLRPVQYQPAAAQITGDRRLCEALHRAACL